MSTNATILYVEDNLDNRTLVRRILTAEGYTLLEAANAAQAIDILKTTKPDLILMDINMPDMDGYSLTAKIKDTPRFESTPIIALTANVMRGDRERFLEAGCNDYLSKPVNAQELHQMVDSYYPEIVSK